MSVPGSKNLDLLVLRLPSEAIEVAQLERMDATGHPAFTGLKIGFEQSDLNRALYLSMRLKETSLAKKAFCKACSQPDPFPQSSRESLVRLLADDYQFFGLASGLSSTEELVREFESRAASQLPPIRQP